MKKSTRQKSSIRKRILRKEDVPLYLMAAPAVVLLLMFSYLPMSGILLAFKDYQVSAGIFGSRFVGFDNFKFLFSTTDVWIIVRNTLLYNIVFIIVNMLLALLFSLLLNELHSKRTAKIFQTIYMMPYFISWAAVAILVSAFLERSRGLLNQVMLLLGGEGQPLKDWYAEAKAWPYLLVFIHAWKNVGYQTVLYLAVISGISSEYYEAAMLDGASRFQQAQYITIPHLRFIISISIILSMGHIFRGDFGLFYTVTQDSGRLYRVTNVIDTYIYRAMLNYNTLGMSAATGFLQSTVGLVFILLTNKIVSLISPESSMF